MTSASKLRFHLVADHTSREFFLDEGCNGMRLHYEVQLAARAQNKNLRESDIWVESLEAAVAEIQGYLPGYRFMGEWTRPQRGQETPGAAHA